MFSTSFKLRFLFLLGSAALLFTHLYQLTWLPGFHFDEAWAANYAYRIATEKNFWPMNAMSAYTAPWAHYGAALFFHVFGTSLFIFRASQIFFVFAGIFLSSLALRKKGERVAAALLPLFLAFFPALVMNHRFAIEMNGFHVFCFGLLIYGVAYDRALAVIAGALLGVTAHVLFLAQLLALLVVVLLFSSPKEIGKKWRYSIVAIALLLLPFFYSMSQQLPSPGKAYALMIAALLVSTFFSFELSLPTWILQKKKIFFALLALAALPFLANLLFFSEGAWQVLLTHGIIANPNQQMLYVLPLVVLLKLWRTSIRLSPAPWLVFFLASTFLAGLMMLKPTPRYFELPLFSFAILVVVGLSRLPLKISFPMLCLFCGMGFTSLAVNYGLVHEVQGSGEREFRVLFYKDSSRDFLNKQKLTQYLGLKGCDLSAIVSGDGRVLEALHFLAHGDWLTEKKTCDGPWRVERLHGDIRPAKTPAFQAFDFGLWKEGN